MYGVLFVCTGNICRSPTAEAFFRHLTDQEGLAIRVDSAGIEGYHAGDPPDSRAVRALLNRGISMESLRARQVKTADFSGFDRLVAMDGGHLAHLKRLCPKGLAGRVSLFMDHVPGRAGEDVPDPYYGGPADFDLALRLIEAGTKHLLEDVRRDINLIK